MSVTGSSDVLEVGGAVPSMTFLIKIFCRKVASGEGARLELEIEYTHNTIKAAIAVFRHNLFLSLGLVFSRFINFWNLHN